MSEGAKYPISLLLARLIADHGGSPAEFIGRLGYRNIERGLRRLDPWMTSGEGYDRIIKEIAAAYPEYAEELKTAIGATKAVKTAEAEAAFLELCKAEAETFIPFIHTEGEHSVPQQITFFAVSGSHRRWTTIQIPQSILSLPLQEQLERLPELMAAYKEKYEGQVPFFGKLTGFKFVRALDCFQFDADGRLLKHVQKPFRHGECWVELR